MIANPLAQPWSDRVYRLAGRGVSRILSRLRIAGVLLISFGTGSSFAAEKTFECVVEPSLVVEIGGPVPGLLSEVMVRRGDRVSKGRVVAKLNSRVEEATVNLLNEKANNTAEIDAQKARAELAISRAGRAKELVKRNVTSKDRFEEAMSQMEVLKREVAMAEMRHRVSKLELARAETVLDQRSIRSPIDGVVTERFLYGGEYLDQEDKVATIAKLDPLNVETYLPVELFGQVRVGMQAKVIPALPIEGSYDGRVTVVDQVFDAASGTFGVRISLPNPGLRLPAGHRCEVEFAEASN